MKQLLARVMNISRTDPISWLPKDLLSLLVYSFFPASHMYWHPFTGSHQMIPLYIIEESIHLNICTGSLPEYLHLPFRISELY